MWLYQNKKCIETRIVDLSVCYRHLWRHQCVYALIYSASMGSRRKRMVNHFQLQCKQNNQNLTVLKELLFSSLLSQRFSVFITRRLFYSFLFFVCCWNIGFDNVKNRPMTPMTYMSIGWNCTIYVKVILQTAFCKYLIAKRTFNFLEIVIVCRLFHHLLLHYFLYRSCL